MSGSGRVQPPTVEDVERWWLELVDGRSSRSAVSLLAAPWVETASAAEVPGIVSLGLTYLHGADLVEAPDAEESGRMVVRHSGQGTYLRSLDDLRADLSYWRGQVAEYRGDPVAWRERRLAQARAAVEEERGHCAGG